VESDVSGLTDEKAYGGELQYLHRTKPINIVSGAGYFDVDTDSAISQVLSWPGTSPPTVLPFGSTQTAESDVNHANLYLYSYLNFIDSLTVILGGSGDFFENEVKETNILGQSTRNLDEDQFNPKVGVTWNVLPSTTLRGAVFRTLTRKLITDQTLEPTQVAGFNQFFDDPDATEAWVYGGALDQKFSTNVYGGVELVYRDLTVPAFIQPFPGQPFERIQADSTEYLGRAYLYWTPFEMMSLSAEYLYEDFERDDEVTFGIKEVTTHRFPLGVNFFHPSGLNVGVKATYYDQDGQYQRQDAFLGTFTPGSDKFWLFDAVVSLRLPQRYGMVSAGVANLFDEEFNFVDTDIANPTIQPDRRFFIKLDLAFP
jgi:hypothetical protein